MADNGINMENHENSSEFRRLERPIQIGDELIGVSGDQYKRAIVSDAILVFEFNLTKNLLMGNPLQRFGERIVRLRHAFDLPEECSYDKFLDSVSWDLSDSEKEKFMANMDASYLMDAFITGKYELWFDINKPNFEGESFWTRNTVILTQEKDTGDILGLAVVKNITSNYKREEEKVYQLEIINALSIDYTNVFMVNLMTNRIRIVRMNDVAGAFYSDELGEQYYDDALEFYIDVSVYADDRDMMRMAFSRDNILRQLIKRETFYVNFRSNINNKLQYMKLKVVRIGDIKETGNFLLAFMNVDDEIEHEMKQKKLLQDTLSMAESASHAKTMFLSNMSHDIRTPMNAIIGFTTLALNHISEQAMVKTYLDKIKSSSNHLLSLINDVLDMSRIESGKMKINKTVSTVEKIVGDVDTVMQSQIQMKHLEYSLIKRGILTRPVMMDGLRLNQILINIVGNAVKYTPEYGKVQFMITEMPSISDNTSSYQFRIKDNGIGMSKKFLEKIFTPFERDENKAIAKIQGTGLGLAITKSLVDIMEGSIFVKSEEGKGSEFLVCFDLENAKEGELSVEEKKENVYESSVINSFKDVRILLVEDNELNREIATELLKSVGFILDEAENGSQAVQMVNDSPAGYYKVILMDVMMPVMNGYESTKKIRSLEDKAKANVPIIAMTANAFEEDKNQAIECGMDKFVSKPFDINDLLVKLKEMIDMKVHSPRSGD
ncbi:MAG: response regulator [Treponema sp.]|uniref:hybrid sensor histidine kinase/response regulator n=1 Tax=Treponema sp. TaxID=166 RepID=UPI001DF8D98A|nr:response regulator [Treponema sp.]MBS7241400.1 response regulator [Treponema sp.]